MRFATGQSETLAPLSADMAGRFNLWLGRERRAGRVYSEEQLGWLEAIRDYLAANIEVTPADLQESFAAKGGMLGARRAFGPRLESLLDELAGRAGGVRVARVARATEAGGERAGGGAVGAAGGVAMGRARKLSRHVSERSTAFKPQ